MGLKLGLQVGLHETYPEESPENLGSYLNGIPRDTVLLVVSSLLGKKEVYSTKLADILGIWFRASNSAFANDAYERLRKIEQEFGQPISIITQPTVLKIFAYANNHLTEEKVLTDEQIEINLFKSFLYQNELTNNIEKIASATTENLDKEIRLYALQFTNAVRFSDVVNFNLFEVFVTEFIRAVLFFEFLERTDEAKFLLKEFYNHYEVNDWREFLKRISGLSFSIFKKEKDGHLELTVPNDESFDSNIKFLDRLAAVKYDELTDNDFKVVRERPLHKVNEGKYRIISELFTVERIFKGLYFNLKAVNETLKKGEKVKDLRFLYTYHFSEKQVCYEILGRTFSKKHLRFTGEELDKAGLVGAPDYYVRNNNKVFIFESKDSLLNAALKESGDFASIEPELIKKFYQDGKDAKAVNQLLAFIKSMLTKVFLKWDNTYKLDTARIYPIIVIHDRQLDVPGLNKIINFWYFSELEKLKKDIEIKSKVYPITLMTISTLILTHELFLDRRLLLEEMIEEYHEFTKIKDPRHFGSQRQFEKHFMDTGLPFSNFIKGQVKKKNLPRIPDKMIKEKAIIALDS